ncbi:MAG: hypothetical protein L0Y62_05635 [Nitrospirae bacterium]|nr:hypothetical protein [Nitrospirota bacterium]
MLVRLILLVCLTIIFLPPSGALSLMLPISTEELTRGSDIVIIGEVVETKSYWGDGRKAIYTLSSVKATRIIKGEAREGMIYVEYLGGEVEDIGMRVSDSVSLRKGESVLLFLKSAGTDGKERGISEGAGFYNVVGMAQGKYRIESGNVRKDGFKVMNGEGAIDNDMPLDVLIEKIRGVK